MRDIHEYYESLAADYDLSHFGDSYGDFLHRRETDFLRPLLELSPPQNILNLACGTGRFMEFCGYGVDFSRAMLERARSKYPNKEFILAKADDTGLPDQSFDLIICMHLIMDLGKEATESVFDEAHRLLRPGGRLVFDVPAKRRRKLFRVLPKSWRGANAYTLAELAEIMNEQDWEALDAKGLLALPIQRLPESIRHYFYNLDKILTDNASPEYTSYMLIVARKQQNDLILDGAGSIADIT